MREKKRYEYKPDYYVIPGETLQETIEYLNMTQSEFAKRMGMTEQSLVRIIKGEQPITQETAQKLELVTGTSNEFWMNLEAQYHKQKQLVDEHKKAELYSGWLKQLPVQELIKRKYINKVSDVVLQVREVLGLFRISSIETFDSAVTRMAAMARGSATYDTHPITAFTYIAMGLKDAERVAVEPYDRTKLKNVLHQVKAMTSELPEDFCTRIQSLFASAGVALVYVPQIKGVHLHGVSKWLSPTKAMIIMNIRGKGEDKFWFSLFHEASHLLLHSKRMLYIADSSPKDDEEREADKYAADFLIPESYNDRIVIAQNQQDIEAIAAELGIAPGIVVGRYHHLTGKWQAFTHLIRKLEWKNDTE
ncbi:MAG: addiction module antidote protein, HigA family [Candidatus Cloacimonetes bacterium HGW-Cloacimonetes-3]|jgi:addiction module HigA family antidote|nr:MAG: addiction module antidote protein, HigA family [Candidatus Cloacimonetes bacterium HGW-Cloacimonetes-3]